MCSQTSYAARSGGWSLTRGWTDYSDENGVIAVRIGVRRPP
jgi:hypothetical protein